MTQETYSVQNTADDVIKRLNEVIATLNRNDADIADEDREYAELLKSTCSTFIVDLLTFTSNSDEELKRIGLYVDAVRTVSTISNHTKEIEASIQQ